MMARWSFHSWKRLDWIMVTIVALLMAIGILFVFSADSRTGNPAVGPLYQKQLVWMAVGLVCFFVMALSDYHQWIRMAWWLYGAALVMLVLVFVPHVGVKIFGATRWIQVAGLWVFQPAELMKLAVVLVLARLFGWPGQSLRHGRIVLLGLALVLAPLVLIVKQPDLGTAIIFLPVLVAVMYAAGVPGRILVPLVTAGGLVVVLVLAVIVIPPKLGWNEARQERLIRMIGLNPYQRDRILVFVDSDRDPLGTGWNKAQSQIAIGSGRFWGKGYMQGTQNILGFLPRTVAPNDFIFSVIAEEKGFMGSMTVLMLFALMIHLGLRVAAVASDKIGRLLCVGIVTILFCHVFVNIAMTIGVLPITGIPLPLISYGGTFMIGTMTALGMMQSVYIWGDWR
ncbi:MAG: rod shape-determining protein RodA [Verrucomicrobia bacterium]|nr:rod shape-determining protein RodA [Verrucomicrobiota bacterium]MCG2679627.1 rod shape-determining protein RodA [Kiritimatiellia bacterium]MBU4248176.1 rod shape-determining protein RodA [Verrucomicrobiota bacterium]MBU4289686.1 rod shape-determining protein RodA [Verrucomicrobiota bacterium]MBU4429013.1 rod shape-determining protein RodA [Verrucomicrobiota bacterium]